MDDRKKSYVCAWSRASSHPLSRPLKVLSCVSVPHPPPNSHNQLRTENTKQLGPVLGDKTLISNIKYQQKKCFCVLKAKINIFVMDGFVSKLSKVLL